MKDPYERWYLDLAWWVREYLERDGYDVKAKR